MYVVDIFLKLSGKPEYVFVPAIIMEMPRKRLIVARVVTRGGILVREIIIPLRNPHNIPQATERMIASGTLWFDA
jgi:hypothetical protein